jgi:hypothetical protein
VRESETSPGAYTLGVRIEMGAARQIVTYLRINVVCPPPFIWQEGRRSCVPLMRDFWVGVLSRRPHSPAVGHWPALYLRG